MNKELTYVFIRNNGNCWKLKIDTSNINLNIMEMRLNLLNQFNLK